MKLKEIEHLINSDEEIRILSIDPNFGTYTFDALKYAVSEILGEDGLSPFLVMGDINNLYQWNNRYPKERVNVFIREIIKKIHEIVNGKENIIAKRGDEIYIFLPNSSKEGIEEIKEKIKDISVNGMTVSVGASGEIEEGDIETAFDDSDKEMTKDKKENKKKVLEYTYGNNIKDILKYLLNNRLERSRIDLEKMTLKQVKEFKKNVLEAIKHVEVEINNPPIEDSGNIEQESEKYITRQNNQIRKYKKFSQENGQIDNAYVMKQALMYDVEEECLRDRYFQGIVLPKAKEEEYVGKELVLINLSGIKIVNSKYGHTICDSRIREKIREIKDGCANIGIERTSPIIMREAEEAYFFVKPSEKLSVFLDKVNLSNNEKSEIIVHASNSRIPEISDNITTKELVNGTLMNLREREENFKYNYIVSNQRHLQHMIRALVNSIEENSIIQSKIEENSKMEEKIIKYMKAYFNLRIMRRIEKTPRTARSTIKSSNSEH